MSRTEVRPHRRHRGPCVRAGRVLCAVAAALLLGACPTRKAASPEGEAVGPRPVEIVEARVVSWPDEIVSRAVVEPERTVALTPEASGVIREITKGEGERVSAGETLVVIASDGYRGGVEQATASGAAAEASAEQAKAQLDAARTQLERMRSLRADRAVTQADLEQAEAAYDTLRAAYAAAQAQADTARAGLRTARRMLGDTVVRAPFDGYVVEQRMHPGDVVRPMPPGVVLVLMDVDPVRVVGSAGELDLPRVSPGLPAKVHLDAFPGRSFEARVETINPLVDPLTRRARVRVALPNPDHAVKPGMVGRLVLTLGVDEQLVIPRLAIGPGATARSRIWVVEDGRAQPREVRLGRRAGDEVAVLEGLEAGEDVVTWGREALAPGVPVEVIAP